MLELATLVLVPSFGDFRLTAHCFCFQELRGISSFNEIDISGALGGMDKRDSLEAAFEEIGRVFESVVARASDENISFLASKEANGGGTLEGRSRS
jgi:hypothetical protein